MNPEYVKRPVVVNSFSYAEALRATLTNQQALVVPLNGDAYAVVRNRKCGSFGGVAKALNCRLRSARSADGLSLLVWLEPKDSPANGDGR